MKPIRPVFISALLAAFLAAGCGSNSPDLLLEQGIRACEAGRYRSAAHAFEKAARLEPRHPAAQLWCGVALYRSGHAGKALPYFKAAADLDPANPLPLEYAALAHAQRGEWLETARNLNEAFRRMPDSARILNAMGVASAMRGSAAASRAQLAQSLRLSAQYAPAVFNSAILCRDAMKQPEEARRLFERYLELAPDGERADAARKALDALGPAPAPPAGAPAGPRRSTRRVDGKAAVLMRQAQTAIQRGDYDEAVVRFQEAMEAAPGAPDPLWELARMFDGKAGQPVRALDAYRDFIRAFADDARAVQARLRVNELAGRRPIRPPTPAAPPPGTLAESELTFRKPEARNPGAAQAALRRGANYFQQQDWDRAQFDFKRAIELDDSLPEGYFNLGLVYWSRGDDEHARQLFQMALAKKPEWADARCMLARVYLRQRLGLKAVEHFNEILKTDPGYADAYYELGAYFSGTPSQKTQVRNWYSRYLKLAPKGPYAALAHTWLAANP